MVFYNRAVGLKLDAVFTIIAERTVCSSKDIGLTVAFLFVCAIAEGIFVVIYVLFTHS